MHSTRYPVRAPSKLAMKLVAGAILVALFLVGGTSPWAHHGSAAFELHHVVRMQGTVTDFQWNNPHAIIHADLKDKNGRVANWKVELGSLGMLSRFGWSQDTVKRGDRVTAEGFLAKNGSPYMSLVHIDLPSGKTMPGSP